MPRFLILSNPRSGSTMLTELLNCHPEIYVGDELLNDEIEIPSNIDVLDYVESCLSTHPETFVGFKVFPEQLFIRSVKLKDLVKHLGITQIIVLWRENLAETFVSRQIADETGQWYSTKPSDSTTKTLINPQDLQSYIDTILLEWGKIAEEWPLSGIPPTFTKFEDLIFNPLEQVQKILSHLACPSSNEFRCNSTSKRQNPAKLAEKILNFQELPEELLKVQLNVAKIFEKNEILETHSTLLHKLAPETLPFAPDREPCIPPCGWRYRVAEPFISTTMRQNVYDAMESGSISSAGYWPRQMTSKLKALFKLPVAQPCSNGFTALMLAFQCAGIEERDEVIMPSMTMVAVPNAVHFVRGKPVFADCAEGDYNPGWGEILAVSGERTKAVVVTHTYGVPSPDLEKIAEECQSRGWWLIEDISEGVGVVVTDSKGGMKLLGTFGDFACASMYVNKMVHAGDGGFVIARDAKFGMRLTSLVNHGFTPAYHFVHFEPAINAKINGVGAAIACGAIDEIERIMQHRSHISKLYRENLSNLPISVMPICGPLDTPWVFGIQCDSKKQRTEIRAFLANAGIETRDFFFALHLQPAYFNQSQMQLRICETLGSTGFYLPTHSNLTEEDIVYISEIVKMFFNSKICPEKAPFKKDPLAVGITPGTFRVAVRAYNSSGSLDQTEFRGHIYIEAVKLCLTAEEVLMHERWDEQQEIILRIKELIQEATEQDLEMVGIMQECFDPYLKYFETQMHFEQTASNKPWLLEDIILLKNDNELSKLLQQIPTTSDVETLQLLIHVLKEQRSENIWEIGCWMGHSTFLMAAVAQKENIKQKIFACDAFKWQQWMERFVPTKERQLQSGESFLKYFEKFTEPFSTSIQPVHWPYDIEKLPIELENQKPDLIFLDITQEAEDLEEIWKFIKPNLASEKTIILFNGLSHKSIPFFTNHAEELVAIAKPNTIAKAFKYVKSTTQQEQSNSTSQELVKKLNFQSDPGWTHHHKNLFCSSVALLRENYHDPSAPILFFAAVEEKMCDEPELFLKNLWVGIIHSVASYPELFYTPDLQRLCSPKYAKMMRNCRGLFTLTQFQSDFLRMNLPKEYSFPIQPIKYPVENIPSFGPSEVPALWRSPVTVDLLFVGSFARDFKLFFDVNVPSNLKKILVAGDSISEDAANSAPDSVTIRSRLNAEEYEEMLKKSLVFLSLKYDGAANTIILECIARNIPIVCPNMNSCVEYLGTEYPLLYDSTEPNLESRINLENIEKSIEYLANMEKSHLSQKKLMESFKNGAVLQSIPPFPKANNLLNPEKPLQIISYDVTICICSYKRTHHLKEILEALWNLQDYSGSYEIIVWNNNESRSGTVQKICSNFIQKSNEKRSLQLINSSHNHFCSVRFAMPPLMASNALLICDDDIIPGPNFISFFLSAYEKHPKDVLCVRGHVFLPHELNLQNPRSLWEEYEHLRFKNDDAPEQLIHFVHADACLIPKKALREIASVEMPDATFNLVDDYWMSFILSSKFNRKLRKLSVQGLATNPISRTEDSDQQGLALHTRMEVMNARLSLYVHHMIKGWPVWDSQPEVMDNKELQQLKAKKSEFWDNPQLGFNIFSKVTSKDIQDLVKLGVKAVRIGAVGIGGESEFDLCELLQDPEELLDKLGLKVRALGNNGIKTVLTVDRRLANAGIWRQIAMKFATERNIIGYDLINEPFTEKEIDMHWTDLENEDDEEGMLNLVQKYTDIIKAVREVDQVTPIILEPSFWGRFYAVSKFPTSLLSLDSNLILSFHFYEPMILTQRIKNRKRFSFPLKIPVFDGVKHSEMLQIDEKFILDSFQAVKTFADENNVRVFLGEFGICRDIFGASKYLRGVMEALRKLRIAGFIFSFRDADWEAMDYELGPFLTNVHAGDWDSNEFMIEISRALQHPF